MQATLKALLISCFAAALWGAAAVGEKSEELFLSGSISERSNVPCVGVGDECTQPLSGPNVTIWHGDSSCSKLYLYCGLDRITLVLESSPTATDASLLFLGIPPVADPRSRDECFNEQRYGSKFRAAGGDNRMVRAPAGRIVFSALHNKCETKHVVTSTGEEFSNTVEALEFLAIPGYTQPEVLLVSRTNVHVQCCLRNSTSYQNCVEVGPPEPRPPAFPLVDCNEKDFDFDCVVNSQTEQFVCTIQLRTGQTLGTDKIGYYVDSCDASSADGSQTVNLIKNGDVQNEGLEVTRRSNGAGNADQVQFEIRTPYFQFASAARDEIDASPVTINCAVKFALAADVGAWQANLGSWVAPRSSAGQSEGVRSQPVLQTGKLSLRK